jgi:hypothetical protein
MDRRKLIAFGLVALLAATAGCSSQGSLSMEPADNETLTEEASLDDERLQPGTERALLDRVLANGSTTVTDTEPPFDRDLPFRHDGGFYNVSHTATGSQQGYEVTIPVDYNASSVSGDVVGYEELPAVDQTALEPLLTRPERPDGLLEPGYDTAIETAYTEPETEESVLVREQTYDAVRYEGETYPLETQTTPESLTVYRYESTLVAETVDGYAATLRDRYAFELSGLSEDERDVLESALDDTKRIDSDDNQGFDSLVDRFRDRQPVTGGGDSGTFLVRYDGQLYVTEINVGSYAEG